MRCPNRLGPISLLVFLASAALAQTGVGISPPRVELAASPGTTLTQTIVVDHPGASGAMEVDAYLNDVLLGPEGDPIYLDPGLHARSLGPWLTLTPLRFTLDPQQRVEARYTVEVPADAPDGTYWGVVFFESGPLRPEAAPAQGIGVRTRVRIGHVVYVHVGALNRAGRIGAIRYEPSTGAGRPAEVRVLFQNEGNALVRLHGAVEIRTTEGVLTEELTFTDVASFPGATHEIAVAVVEPLAAGAYVALAVLDFGESSVVVGEGAFSVP